MGIALVKRQRLIGVMMLAAMVALLLAANVTAYAPADGAFMKTWQRTDKPVADQSFSGTWIWGPEGNTPAFEEQYSDSPGGTRQVQYFDKSRMEINDPDADAGSPWYVTNGLLATELMTGMLQLGDREFAYRQPSDINALGDFDAPNTPSYEALNRVADLPPYDAGQVIDYVIDANGATSRDGAFAAHNITAAHYVHTTNHQVASPFWTFMNSTRPIYQDGAVVNGQKLFQDPFYATGLPTTEAYWVHTVVGGTPADVLVQAFERRVLTYTPSNPDGWKVEAGNVGLHYYHWRYGDQVDENQTTVYMVAIGDDGASGPPVGCNDSLIGVKRYAEMTDNVATNVSLSLKALFAIDDEWYGQSGFYNALHQSSITVTEVTNNDGVVTVSLDGATVVSGVCDEPRLIGQIVLTVLNVPGVTGASITLNGEVIH